VLMEKGKWFQIRTQWPQERPAHPTGIVIMQEPATAPSAASACRAFERNRRLTLETTAQVLSRKIARSQKVCKRRPEGFLEKSAC